MMVEEEGFVHKLVIANPTLADMGKYTCDINGVTTEAYLEVEGAVKDCIFACNIIIHSIYLINII
jgi:hypothetical protein